MVSATAQTAVPVAASNDTEMDGLLIVPGVHWGFIRDAGSYDLPFTMEDET